MATLRKSVLVTGCSAGGIGAALAEAFHSKGYHVFATARTPSKIPKSLSDAKNVTVLQLDVLSSESIHSAAENVKREAGGKLDVLVNNSGGGLTMPALDVSITEGKKLFDLNFWAPLAMLQAFSPLLIQAKGCVVNNSSANAHVSFPLFSIYTASKAALAAASESWRLELRPLGVRTITLITCAVKTNFFADTTEIVLPETSKYNGIRGFINEINDGRLQATGISTSQYANKVVREVEKGTVGEVWVGKDAFMAWLGWALSPRAVLDTIIESLIPISKEMAKASGKKV